MADIAVQELANLGCCPRCILRFLGGSVDDVSGSLESVKLKIKKICNDNEVSPSMGSDNEVPLSMGSDNEVSLSMGSDHHLSAEVTYVCTVCLGLLQDRSKNLTSEVVKFVQGSGFQYNSFRCSVHIPLAVVLREHAVHTTSATLSPAVAPQLCEIKDVWKRINKKALCDKLDVPVNFHSPFEIVIKFSHSDDEEEVKKVINEIKKPVAQKSKRRSWWTRKRKKQNNGNVTSQANTSNDNNEVQASHIEVGSNELKKLLAEWEVERFLKVYDISLHKCPCESIYLSSMSCNCASIYIAGRYNKYSRCICQTPWLINGERKVKQSVEEIITEPLNNVIKADETKFQSSGREDVDVQMLGDGRPFAIEFVNPRYSRIAQEELDALQNVVNESCKDVRVTHLQLVKREDLKRLKDAEETKTKRYSALCWSPATISQSQLCQLSFIKDLVIQQQTPIRVLHRRAQAVRDRVILEMKATEIDDHHFCLEIEANAGTYIKEFVHSDFGRTVPSLSTLLGQETDILALDVLQVNVDWPKPTS